MTIDLFLACAIVGVFYILATILLVAFFNHDKIVKTLAIVFASLYILLLIIGVFSDCSIEAGKVFIAFKPVTIWGGKTINLRFWHFSKIDFIINLVLLAPIGEVLVLALIKNNNNIKKIFLILFICGLCAGLFIETVQFFIPYNRSVQLSDVIFNTISMMLGGGAYILLLKLFKKLQIVA